MTPRILAIDTTSEFGSLALLSGAELIDEVPLRSTEGYGHLIFPHVELLLARHAWRLEEIDCFCGASGPGSFTGIRVGLAAIQGLGAALAKPVIGVSTLRAMAACGSAALRAVFIDARRGEIYGGIFTDSLALVTAESVQDLGAWLAALPGGDIELISRDLNLLDPLPAGSPWAAMPQRRAPLELAGAVGRIVAAQFSPGGQPASNVQANYVRRSDAELFWREW